MKTDWQQRCFEVEEERDEALKELRGVRAYLSGVEQQMKEEFRDDSRTIEKLRDRVRHLERKMASNTNKVSEVSDVL